MSEERLIEHLKRGDKLSLRERVQREWQELLEKAYASLDDEPYEPTAEECYRAYKEVTINLKDHD